MRRQKSKPKLKLKFPFKPIIISIIILIALYLIIGYIGKVFLTSKYFGIKEIFVRGNEKTDLSYLKGTNIFSLNLKDESRRILESYPDYSYVNLVKILPDRIFIDFITRKPLAFVKLYKYFALDDKGVLFGAPGLPGDLDLPVIMGLETKIFGPRPGTKYNLKEVLICLNILKEMNKNKFLKDYKIKKIDVADPANTSFFIPIQAINAPFGMEVRIGQDNIKNKMAIFAGLIKLTKNDLGKIKYIDLRFKDPVIKYKNDVK
jgi:cell division septal protein FtsQ